MMKNKKPGMKPNFFKMRREEGALVLAKKEKEPEIQPPPPVNMPIANRGPQGPNI